MCVCVCVCMCVYICVCVCVCVCVVLCNSSYEFVRKLQGRVNAVVGPLVDAKMDEVDSQDAQVVAQITQEVLSSTE